MHAIRCILASGDRIISSPNNEPSNAKTLTIDIISNDLAPAQLSTREFSAIQYLLKFIGQSFRYFEAIDLLEIELELRPAETMIALDYVIRGMSEKRLESKYTMHLLDLIKNIKLCKVQSRFGLGHHLLRLELYRTLSKCRLCDRYGLPVYFNRWAVLGKILSTAQLVFRDNSVFLFRKNI